MNGVSWKVGWNLWVSMCLRPRATIQHIVDTDPKRQVISIAALIGVVLQLFSPFTYEARASLGLMYLIIALPIGAIFGVLGVFLSGALLRWTGRWIGGQASTLQLRAAATWGQVPMLIGGGLMFLVSLFTLRGQLVVDPAWAEAHPDAVRVLAAVSLVYFIGAIWALVTSAKALSQVQKFSVWRALLNMLLVTLVMVATVLPAVLILKIGLAPRPG